MWEEPGETVVIVTSKYMLTYTNMQNNLQVAAYKIVVDIIKANIEATLKESTLKESEVPSADLSLCP